jgi:hypothetical protein
VQAGQFIPHNLTGRFRDHPLPRNAPDALEDVSPAFQDLYVTDFEMARLKQIRDSTVLRHYLKAESYIPKEFMSVAQFGLKLIVNPRISSSEDVWVDFA